MIYEILDSEGNVVNRIEASLEFVESAYPNCHREVAVITPTIAVNTKITQLAFKKRFPAAKWKAARAAATVGSDLADFFEDFDLATYVDLARADVIASVNSLTNNAVPSGFRLTSAEALSILTDSVQEAEKYHGVG